MSFTPIISHDYKVKNSDISKANASSMLTNVGIKTYIDEWVPLKLAVPYFFCCPAENL